MKNFSPPPWEDGPSSFEEADGADGIGGVAAGTAVGTVGTAAHMDAVAGVGVRRSAAAARAMAFVGARPPLLAEDKNPQPEVVPCTRNYEKYVDTQKNDVFYWGWEAPSGAPWRNMDHRDYKRSVDVFENLQQVSVGVMKNKE